MEKGKFYLKSFTLGLLALLSLSFIFSGNLFQVVPADENIESKFKESVNDYAKDSSKSFIEKFIDDIIDNGSKEETVPSVLSYLLVPGHYMDDISKATTVDNNDNTVFDDSKSLCNVSNSQPQNLLNHNCDLPTIGTEIAQKISSTFESYGISNGERTPAQSLWGVPSGLPNNTVPTDPNARAGKYTALELYGYNLQYVNYKGEWDDIQTSTKARVLSNYGFWARTRLDVDTIWNGAKGGFKAIVEKFDWNPVKYVSNIINGTVSSALWTAVDTSDYNVAASHAWTRPEFAKTLYNVYYLNSNEIAKKAQAEYLKQIKNILKEELDKEEYKQLKTFFDVDPDYAPKFTYNPNLTKKVPKIGKDGKQVKNKKGKLVYKKVKVPESEQIKKWYKSKEVASFLSQAKYALGNDCTSAKSGSEFTSCYASAYDSKLQEFLSSEENEGIVSKLTEDVTKNFQLKNIHINPASGISHYICADEEGNPTAATILNYKYVYSRENSINTENLTPGCSLVRPSIKGGYYGTGYSGGNSNDTRWKQFNFVRKTKQKFSDGDSIFNNIAQFVTKLTVTILGISYGNILTELNLDKIAEATITSFRDSLFYPLMTIAVAVGGISIFINVMRTSTPTQGFKTLGLMMLTFASGVIILNNPGNLVKWIDEIPSKMDQFVLGIMPNNASSKQDTLCSNSGGSQNEVRSLQCQIWRINIFNPWVYGQWGTAYENLDATDFTNKNGNLVGKGTVNMGKGVKVNNWALYQLEKTKSGTLTTDSYNSNTTSKALYKVVDLQFGPNNGALSDARYTKQWSGLNGRSGYRLSSALTSIFLAIPIIGIAIAKIEVSFMFAMLLMFLPLLFLYGILSPNKGRLKLIEYGQKMTGLIIKRVFLNLILSFTLYFIIVGTQLSSSYKNVLFFSIALAWGTKIYWKDLINLFNVSAASSQAFISDQVGGLRQKLSESNILPQALNFRYQGFKMGVRDTAVGVAVGGAAGVIQQIQDIKDGYRRTNNGKKNGYRTTAILEGMVNGGRSGARRATNFIYNKERRNGFSLYDNLKDSYKAGRNDYVNLFRLDDSKIARSIKQMSNYINANEKDAFDDRNMKQRTFQTEYARLLGMAADRNIPLKEDNTLDLSDLNDKLYLEDGSINPNFKDTRFDEEFLAQMNRVILASGQLSKAKERHLKFRNAKSKLDEIQKNNFTSDDPAMFKALKSFYVGQDKWVSNEKGQKVKVQVTVQEASDVFVDNVNKLSDFNHDEDIKFALDTINKKVMIYTDKVLRTKDDYVDNVIYNEEVLNNPDYLDRLGQVAVLTEEYITDKYTEYKEKQELVQEEVDNRDYFEKLEDEWDPLFIYKQKMARKQADRENQDSTIPPEPNNQTDPYQEPDYNFGKNNQETTNKSSETYSDTYKGNYKSASQKVLDDIKDNSTYKEEFDKFNMDNPNTDITDVKPNVTVGAVEQVLETVKLNFDATLVEDLNNVIQQQNTVLEKPISDYDKLEEIISINSQEEVALDNDTKVLFNELTDKEAEIVVEEVAYQKVLNDVFNNSIEELNEIPNNEEPKVAITEIPVLKEYTEEDIQKDAHDIIEINKDSDLTKADKKAIVIENLVTIATKNEINPEEVKLSEKGIDNIVKTLENQNWEEVENKTTIPKEEVPKKYYEKVLGDLDTKFKEKIENQNVQNIIYSVKSNAQVIEKPTPLNPKEEILSNIDPVVPVTEKPVTEAKNVLEQVKTNSDRLPKKPVQRETLKDTITDNLSNIVSQPIGKTTNNGKVIEEVSKEKVLKETLKQKEEIISKPEIIIPVTEKPVTEAKNVLEQVKTNSDRLPKKPVQKEPLKEVKRENSSLLENNKSNKNPSNVSKQEKQINVRNDSDRLQQTYKEVRKSEEINTQVKETKKPRFKEKVKKELSPKEQNVSSKKQTTKPTRFISNQETKQEIERFKKSILNEEQPVKKPSKFRIPFVKQKESKHTLPTKKDLVKKKHKRTQANVEEIASASEMLNLINKFNKMNKKDDDK